MDRPPERAVQLPPVRESGQRALRSGWNRFDSIGLPQGRGRFLRAGQVPKTAPPPGILLDPGGLEVDDLAVFVAGRGSRSDGLELGAVIRHRQADARSRHV